MDFRCSSARPMPANAPMDTPAGAPARTATTSGLPALALVLVLVAALVLLSACQRAPEDGFRNTDITGAGYGTTLALTDHTGTPRTLDDFRGDVVVVFFGYISCPDFCPGTLSTLKAVKEQLGPLGNRLKVLFVTVDPERDSQELLAQYVTAFDPDFVGLRGDAEATATVARNFMIFFQKAPGATPDTYAVDHSTDSYVYDPSGRLRLLIRYGQDIGPIVADIRHLLKEKSGT